MHPLEAADPVDDQGGQRRHIGGHDGQQEVALPGGLVNAGDQGMGAHFLDHRGKELGLAVDLDHRGEPVFQIRMGADPGQSLIHQLIPVVRHRRW